MWDDSNVFHFAAGGKRGAPPSPAAAKAIAAIRALPKKGREISPVKGLNPNAIAFQFKASAERSAQQIDDAAFMKTFTWPASSSSMSQNGSGTRDADDARPSAPGSLAHAGMITGNSEAG